MPARVAFWAFKAMTGGKARVRPVDPLGREAISVHHRRLMGRPDLTMDLPAAMAVLLARQTRDSVADPVDHLAAPLKASIAVLQLPILAGPRPTPGMRRAVLLVAAADSIADHSPGRKMLRASPLVAAADLIAEPSLHRTLGLLAVLLRAPHLGAAAALIVALDASALPMMLLAAAAASDSGKLCAFL